MFYFSNGGKNIQVEYYSAILELYETTSKQTTPENSVVVGNALGHQLVEHAAKESTKTEAGNALYYECTRCGKFFSDAKVKNEITKDSWIIPAKSGGCGGTIAIPSAIISVVSLVGVGLLLAKIKKCNF